MTHKSIRSFLLTEIIFEIYIFRKNKIVQVHQSSKTNNPLLIYGVNQIVFNDVITSKSYVFSFGIICTIRRRFFYSRNANGK